MEITKKWLERKNACNEGLNWFTDNYKSIDGIELVNILKKIDLDWTSWLIVRIMNRKQCIQYSVYAAKQVLKNFEKKHPDDKRPREAIDAAQKCIENDTKKNRAAAYAAYASSAAYAAAAYAAAYAAYASSSAYAAYASYAAAKKRMKLKILNFGIKLLTNK